VVVVNLRLVELGIHEVVQVDGPPERVVPVEWKECQVFTEVFATLLARQNARH
jgi:hypothetical protein